MKADKHKIHTIQLLKKDIKLVTNNPENEKLRIEIVNLTSELTQIQKVIKKQKDNIKAQIAVQGEKLREI